MKAALLYGKEDVRVEERTTLDVGSYDMCVKVLCCGVCGSDSRMFFTGPTPRYIHPVILGHEISARVHEVGPQVIGYRPGDLVTLAPISPCMRCAACSRGEDNLCENGDVIGCTVHGGMAEYVHVSARMIHAGGVVRLDPGTNARAGALTELVGCCLEGLDQIRIEPGDRVLIVGDGPIGLTFLQLARLFGAGYVATSGRRPGRRELAREYGATETIDAQSVNLRDKFDRSLDHVIVATANVDAVAVTFDLLRSGGNLLLFSGYQYGTRISMDPNIIHYRQLHVHGSIDCTVRNFRRAARLLANLRMEKLVTASFPLERTAEAFRATRERDAVKITIEPEGVSE